MKPLAIALTAIAVGFPAVTLAGPTFSMNQPQEQYPDEAPPLTSGGPYEALLKQVQEKLNARGFYSGPANGAFTTKTQAALAQFQMANVLPASGALDEATLAELGVERGAASAPENVAGEQKPSEGQSAEQKPGEEKPAGQKPAEEQKLSERPG